MQSPAVFGQRRVPITAFVLVLAPLLSCGSEQLPTGNAGGAGGNDNGGGQSGSSVMRGNGGPAGAGQTSGMDSGVDRPAPPEPGGGGRGGGSPGSAGGGSGSGQAGSPGAVVDAGPMGGLPADAARSDLAAAADAILVLSDSGSQGPVVPQCVKDQDCQLVNDCCNCVALPASDRAPACDPKIMCLTTSCMQYGGVDGARCVAGRCILALDCDSTTVVCKRAPPQCPAGQVPRIIGKGVERCFGECVDARQCLGVPACQGCAKGDLCVKYSTRPETAAHCVPIPPACGGNASCGCVGPGVCVTPFKACVNQPQLVNAISCECPNC